MDLKKIKLTYSLDGVFENHYFDIHVCYDGLSEYFNIKRKNCDLILSKYSQVGVPDDYVFQYTAFPSRDNYHHTNIFLLEKIDKHGSVNILWKQEVVAIDFEKVFKDLYSGFLSLEQ